ncbi:hypothetical protein J2Y63_006828 [Shinella sp. BE166]
MKQVSQQKESDRTLLAAAALVVAGLLAIGVPPIYLFMI